ncbi:MAG: LytTR family transcriptional regulator DNA-binding domain-containing protein [Defluviitaleaceae bacterium]|nr:LytTR family transcriptional regulator DNA-binding domain-containing protein [Defluviitaleaceae bacterium]
MPIRFALFGTSNALLKQARREFQKLSHENQLDLRITVFTCFDEFVLDLRKYDIAVIHETDFYTILLKLTALFKGEDFQTTNDATVVIGTFKIPVSLKDLTVMLDRLPKRDITLDIPITNGGKKESVGNIIYFENRNRRIFIKTVYDSYPTKLTMENVRSLTASHPFASPYVSYMVNLEWVEQITARDVILKNRDIIPLSQKKAARFKTLFREYMSVLH